jgi:hypothetical protein
VGETAAEPGPRSAVGPGYLDASTRDRLLPQGLGDLML